MSAEDGSKFKSPEEEAAARAFNDQPKTEPSGTTNTGPEQATVEGGELTPGEEIQKEVDQITDSAERSAVQKLKEDTLNLIEERSKNPSGEKFRNLHSLWYSDYDTYQKINGEIYRNSGTQDPHSLAALLIINNLMMPVPKEGLPE